MDTTQSKPRRLPVIPVAAGLLLAPAAFLFGGFAALPALLAVAPPLRRLWPFALTLFIGVLGVRGLTLLGVNPVLNHARDRALTELGEALGGEAGYDSFEGDATTGRLTFTGVRVELPELDGGLSIEEVTIDAGLFLMHRPGGYEITGRGLALRVDASGGKLEKYMAARESPAGTRASIYIEGATIDVVGSPTIARLEAHRLSAEIDEGWQLALGLARADLTVIGRRHELTIYGGIVVGDNGEGLWVSADFKADEPELGFGIVRGSITPGGGKLVCTLDRLNLQPLWARYRKVDSFDGTLRAIVEISGDLDQLHFDFDGDVTEYRYYHYTAMGLDPANAFHVPLADVSGRVSLIEGERVEFEDITVQANSATLATGEHLKAQGGGKLTLSGPVENLRGRISLVVESGGINQGISWSPTTTRKLSDVQPNIVLVAEQFARLDLEWEVDVKALSVDCEPLSGTISGKLHGTFVIEDGKRVGSLRAGGDLEMKDGKVKCLGLAGDFAGKLTFNPNAPSYHATLRGSISGSLGDTPIDCEVGGDMRRPGFAFKGANMAPEDLARKIYNYSATELTPEEVIKRREQCIQIFGAGAAAAENPFLARNTGNVFFSVK